MSARMTRAELREETRQRRNAARQRDAFFDENGIMYEHDVCSHYFVLNGVKYCVTNRINRRTPWGSYKEEDVVYIFAGRNRVQEIYNDLVAGYELDGKGRRKQ